MDDQSSHRQHILAFPIEGLVERLVHDVPAPEVDASGGFGKQVLVTFDACGARHQSAETVADVLEVQLDALGGRGLAADSTRVAVGRPVRQVVPGGPPGDGTEDRSAGAAGQRSTHRRGEAGRPGVQGSGDGGNRRPDSDGARRSRVHPRQHRVDRPGDHLIPEAFANHLADRRIRTRLPPQWTTGFRGHPGCLFVGQAHKISEPQGLQSVHRELDFFQVDHGDSPGLEVIRLGVHMHKAVFLGADHETSIVSIC